MNLPAIYEASGAVPQVIEGSESYRYSDDQMTVRYLMAMLRRRREVLVLTLAICVLLALLWTTALPKTYLSTADVVMITKSTQLVPQDKDSDTPGPVRSEDVETQIQLIASREMAAQVLETTGLLKDRVFLSDVIAPRSFLDNFLASLGIDRSDDTALAKTDRAVLIERATTYLLKHLNVARVGESFNLRISFTDSSAERTTNVANAFARLYTTDDARELARTNATAAKVLKARVDELRKSANEAFAAVQDYRIRKGLLSSAATSLTEQEISTYNQQIAEARAEAARDAASLSSARRQLQRSGANGVGEAVSSPVVTSLRAERAQLVIRERDLSQRYFDNNPDLVTTRQQIADIDRQIATEVTRSIKALESRSDSSGKRLSSLLSSRSGTRAQLSTDNTALVALADLEKRADATQLLYQSYLQRYNSVVAESGSEQPSARLVSAATTPLLPISPNLPLNLALGFVVGLLAGATLAVVSELSYRGFTTLDDIENRLGIRALGFIPSHRSVDPHAATPLDTVRDHSDGAFSEALRNVIVSVRQSGPSSSKVIAITSALPGEGKSTIASCLARSLAMANERVVVIDCDVIRAQLSKQFGFISGEQGLYEALHSESGAIAQYTDSDSPMRIIPITRPFAKGERLTERGRLNRVIARLREDFDIIVLDCPPILPIAESREIVSLADHVVLVVHWRKTVDRVAKAAIRQLPIRAIKGLGIVLNKVDMKKQVRFGGSDIASFYKHYRGYYA
ncbi:GumC family protein [Novosphingobium aerophilum]|uniref:GumC family protein n=1 Tax=Novosphingobium TaxID=165696 RepID=UPI002D779AB0|nr:AAA family ATPase [Novosphingobium sp. RL4]WRT93970.1 AAA family ATPase [Novosphingobium sp. RL4]